MKQRWWPFPVALLVGLAVGGAYGLFVKLRIEDYWLVVRASGRPVPIWIASVLVGTVLVDLVGAWWGADARIFRYWAALLALVCAGLLFGRALALTSRLRRLNR
jgi:hypothetical protein